MYEWACSVWCKSQRSVPWDGLGESGLPSPQHSPISTGEMAAHHGGWSHLDELQLSAEGSHLKGLAKSTHRVDISSRI